MATKTLHLYYQTHHISPEDFLHFIEANEFFGQWRDLGFSDDDLENVQVLIMADPLCGEEIEGTGGLYKVEFCYRNVKANLYYVYLEEFFTVLMVSSNQYQEEISESEKEVIKNYIAREKHVLGQGPVR